MHVKTTRIHVELSMASLRKGSFIRKLYVLKLFILKLLATKNKALLISWYALLVLDLLFHVLHGAARLHLELTCLAGRHIHKNLHTAMQTQDQVAVLTTGFPDLNPARAVPIPRERAGFTKSYNPARLLGNSRDT